MPALLLKILLFNFHLLESSFILLNQIFNGAALMIILQGVVTDLLLESFLFLHHFVVDLFVFELVALSHDCLYGFVGFIELLMQVFHVVFPDKAGQLLFFRIQKGTFGNHLGELQLCLFALLTLILKSGQ